MLTKRKALTLAFLFCLNTSSANAKAELSELNILSSTIDSNLQAVGRTRANLTSGRVTSPSLPTTVNGRSTAQQQPQQHQAAAGAGGEPGDAILKRGARASSNGFVHVNSKGEIDDEDDGIEVIDDEDGQSSAQPTIESEPADYLSRFSISNSDHFFIGGALDLIYEANDDVKVGLQASYSNRAGDLKSRFSGFFNVYRGMNFDEKISHYIGLGIGLPYFNNHKLIAAKLSLGTVVNSYFVSHLGFGLSYAKSFDDQVSNRLIPEAKLGIIIPIKTGKYHIGLSAQVIID